MTVKEQLSADVTQLYNTMPSSTHGALSNMTSAQANLDPDDDTTYAKLCLDSLAIKDYFYSVATPQQSAEYLRLCVEAARISKGLT